jgi:CheY-like chemotaxis protein
LAGVFSAQLAKPLKASQLYQTILQVLTAGEAGEHVAEVATASKQAMSSLRLLLAEDNAMNQKVALRLLERLGYSADVVSNGLEALAALEAQPYDVILMDVQMPELDGLDASRRICERWPPESRPHIVAMTANALPEDREACFAAGMNDYVAKPIRADALARALKRARPLRKPDAGSEESQISLDAAALQNLRDLGGAEFLAEVVDVFLADAPALITSLRGSLERKDTEELRRAAHTLKSNGSTLGAAAFAELCRTVEHRAKDGRLDGVSELVDRIEQEYGTAAGNPRLSPVGSDFVSGSAAETGAILIADDNRVNRLLLGRGLEHQGHTVVFAEHGGEALDLLRRQSFDMMLLDVLMPELDGYGVLEELQRDPHFRDIPVIVTSSLDELDSVVRCLEMGAEDYLTKPVNPVLLNARINGSLEKKRLRDQQRELISKFATREVAEHLLVSGFSLGGKYVDASAMFCDIRSFTTIAESQEPAETSSY